MFTSSWILKLETSASKSWPIGLNPSFFSDIPWTYHPSGEAFSAQFLGEVPPLANKNRKSPRVPPLRGSTDGRRHGQDPKGVVRKAMSGLGARNDEIITYYTGWWLSHPSEKYEFVSWDDEIPNIWKNRKCLKPPTSITCINIYHNYNDYWLMNYCWLGWIFGGYV